MGLDVSHEAFTGAYPSFDRFRRAVCEATGGKWPEVLHDQYWCMGDGYGRRTHPGLFAFLTHSDCDGEIDPKTCSLLAAAMEELLPKLDALGTGGGHIARGGGDGEVARKWIAGCKKAHQRNEPLEFG